MIITVIWRMLVRVSMIRAITRAGSTRTPATATPTPLSWLVMLKHEGFYLFNHAIWRRGWTSRCFRRTCFGSTDTNEIVGYIGEVKRDIRHVTVHAIDDTQVSKRVSR